MFCYTNNERSITGISKIEPKKLLKGKKEVKMKIHFFFRSMVDQGQDWDGTGAEMRPRLGQKLEQRL